MKRNLSVQPIDLEPKEQRYDLLISALGFEQRARYLSEQFLPRCDSKIAFAFDQQHCLSFEANRDWFAGNDFKIIEATNQTFRELLKGTLLQTLSKTKQPRLLIDISSQSRYRLAGLVAELVTLQISGTMHVDFVYSLAAFTDPPAYTSPNSHVGPVNDRFSGWWQEPDRPTCAIVGLGYEQDKALGAVEHLEASEVWAFIPDSRVPQYGKALRRANSTLLESLRPERIVNFAVQHPFDTFINLESLIYGLSRTQNPILLPFGPKIFALIGFIVGALHPDVAVWRVSAEEQEVPVDRQATGDICGLSAIVEAQADLEL